MTLATKPPIPEVDAAPAPPNDQRRGERPRALGAVGGVLLASVLLNVLLFDPALVQPEEFGPGGANPEGLAWARGAMWALTAVWLACVFCLWRGSPWARWVVLALSALSIPFTFSTLGDDPPLQTAFSVADALLSGFLLFWLTRPAVAAYYQRASSQVQVQVLGVSMR